MYVLSEGIKLCLWLKYSDWCIAVWNIRHVSNTHYVHIRRENLFYVTHKSYHMERWKSKKEIGKYDQKSLIVPRNFRDRGLDY